MLRNQGRISIRGWKGLNTLKGRKNVAPEEWYESNNVLVNGQGDAEVLRSPNAFGTALGGSGTILGLSTYDRSTGKLLIADRGTVSQSINSAGTVASLRTGQAGDEWTSLTLNDNFHRLDGNEFIQFVPALTVYRNGITAPTVAPVLSSAASGAAAPDIEVSLQCSYSYYNSVTGHISAPSPLSNVLGPFSNNTIEITTTASSQTGVDRIVLFLTTDGGNTPYLAIYNDGIGIIEFSNATGTTAIQLAVVSRDTLTPEPIYNGIPPADASYMFEHKDRIYLITSDGQVQYSAVESCYCGVQEESWPPLNKLQLKDDVAIGGVSTSRGPLVFGEKDCHLLEGTIKDKTSSPLQSLSVSESMTPLNWNFGIQYPKTAVKTPFGPIWVDSQKKVRNWNLSAFPTEIAIPLRSEIDAMTGTLRATWFGHGKDGGYYVLTDGSSTLFVMIYTNNEGKTEFGYGKSDTDMNGITTINFAGTERFFFIDDDAQVQEQLDPDLEGDGWDSGTEIYFSQMIGNDGNFSYLHSISVSGDGLDTMTVTAADGDGGNAEELTLESDDDTDEDVYGLVDHEGRRHKLRFDFALDDSAARVIEGVNLFTNNKKRAI